MLLQELFHMSIATSDFGMDGYLRAIREKLSELSAVGTKLDKDIKLAIILNGLSEEYRYLVVNVEQQETVDFDELSARLIEEERLIKSNDSGGSKLAWMARTKQSARSSGECYYCGQRGHFKPECPVRKFREEKDGEKVVKHQARGARASISM
jgi:gag-polypeptide of LTR copia-type/Zinc knuckle